MTDDKLRQLRELLPATGAGIYLDTANRGPLSAETAAAMREADDWELRVGRVWEGRDDDVLQRHDEARAVLAALIAADPDEITITPGVDAAAALIERTVGVPPEGIEPHIHRATGERVRQSGAGQHPWVVDASLAVGAVPVSVADVAADAVVFAVDRWLLGPENVAAVWLPRGVTREGMSVARTQLIGVARSVGWLEMYVGVDWIFERTAALAKRLHNLLSDAPGVDVLTPASAIAAIVSFRISNWPLDEALGELRRRVFAIINEAPGLDAIRASVAWFNTDEEIDRFAEAVAELARHTPDTLPRRPTLLVH